MEIYDNTLMTLALGGLAVSGLLFASALIYPYLRSVWDKATALARAAFCGAVVVACLFGGAKHKIGGITYPKTDNEVAYLTDAGSYVTNDAVHVAFTRVPTVPDSAAFYLDYCALDGTNEQGVATNWVNAKTATFADLSVPFDFAFANATNYNWVAYTDWTPGPAVQTNGVWHAYWGIDRKEGRYFIPVRTCVRDGGNVIATPKSKWDAAAKTPDSYVQDGLVAMWDGEWNAGRGVHDPNAKTWVDLVGGVAMKSRGSSYTSGYYTIPSWGGDYLWLKNQTDQISIDNLTNASPAFASVAWIEISWRVDNTNNFNCLFTFNNGTGNDTISVAALRVKGTKISFGRGDVKVSDPYGRVFSESFAHASITEGYVNGTPVANPAATGWDKSYAIPNRLQVGRNGWLCVGRVYSIRLYGRKLTEAEVLRNYEIDRARFGSGE